MKRAIKFIYKFLIIYLIFYTSMSFTQEIAEKDLQMYFDKYNVTGSFSFLDVKNNTLTTSDITDLGSAYIPASTFKIINSLIALETGVAANENFMLKWDGVKRNIPDWNKDTYMREAFRNSTVWYYQEIARRIGEERMREWIIKTNYGNMDISGGIDRFWLDGALRITPAQQIEFIRKLYNNELPFSIRNIDIVKSIMARDTINGYVIHAKTGWGNDEKNDIGWYVGFVEVKDNTYIFTANIRVPVNSDNKFPQKRIELTYEILKDLGIL